jgi:hypothetical protein
VPDDETRRTERATERLTIFSSAARASLPMPCLMLGYGLSIPLFFLTTYGWALWIATPLVAAYLRRRLRPDQA